MSLPHQIERSTRKVNMFVLLYSYCSVQKMLNKDVKRINDYAGQYTWKHFAYYRHIVGIQQMVF